MKKLFSNVKFISFVIVLSLVLGSVVGYRAVATKR